MILNFSEEAVTFLHCFFSIYSRTISPSTLLGSDYLHYGKSVGTNLAPLFCSFPEAAAFSSLLLFELWQDDLPIHTSRECLRRSTSIMANMHAMNVSITSPQCSASSFNRDTLFCILTLTAQNFRMVRFGDLQSHMQGMYCLHTANEIAMCQ